MIEDTFNLQFSYGDIQFLDKETFFSFWHHVNNTPGISAPKRQALITLSYKVQAPNQIPSKYLKLSLDEYQWIQDPSIEVEVNTLRVLNILSTSRVLLLPYLKKPSQETLMYISDKELDELGADKYVRMVQEFWPNILKDNKKTNSCLLYLAISHNRPRVLQVLLDNFKLEEHCDNSNWYYYPASIRTVEQLKMFCQVPGFDINMHSKFECVMTEVTEHIPQFLTTAVELGFDTSLVIDGKPFYEKYDNEKKQQIIQTIEALKEQKQLLKEIEAVRAPASFKV